MAIDGRYFDEILRQLYEDLLKSNDTFEASKGKGNDLLAPTVVLSMPRARISATLKRGKIISALGEFCWYMSGSADLDFIRFYIPDYPSEESDKLIKEAYGPRLMGSGAFGRTHDQLSRVIERLRENADSRRAIISILEPIDLLPEKKEAPCTSALQFIRRRERLHMIAMMRSNDAYVGFPHDVFCFTMIQELVARALGIQVGTYRHFATSLHLYERDFDSAKQYLLEGFQSPTFSMPKMPSGCQLDNLGRFLEIEKTMREGKLVHANEINLPAYWKDLALVLLRRCDWKYKRGAKHLRQNFANISDEFYATFFDRQPRIVEGLDNPTKDEKQETLGFVGGHNAE